MPASPRTAIDKLRTWMTNHVLVVIDAASSCGCRGWIRMKMAPAIARATADIRVRVVGVMLMVRLLVLERPRRTPRADSKATETPDDPSSPQVVIFAYLAPRTGR